MVQKVAYGENKSGLVDIPKMTNAELVAIIVLLALIITLGIYPQGLLDLVLVQ
jgi:NADH:ubiquinone oxidoreductase subunit 4 (subunit M)